MKFQLEAPERDLEYALELGDPTTPVAVIGEAGSGKSLIASSLLVTAAGLKPKENEKLPDPRGFRGVFPGLVWLGEGASSRLDFETAGDSYRDVQYHPYDLENQPNLMEYGGDRPLYDAVAYVGGMGNFLLSANMTVNILGSMASQPDAVISLMQDIAPGANVNRETIRELTAYLNRSTTPAFSTLLCALTTMSAVSSAHMVILDFVNPGFSAYGFSELHRQLVLIARRRSIKLITFLQSHSAEQTHYDKVVKLA